MTIGKSPQAGIPSFASTLSDFAGLTGTPFQESPAGFQTGCAHSPIGTEAPHEGASGNVYYVGTSSSSSHEAVPPLQQPVTSYSTAPFRMRGDIGWNFENPTFNNDASMHSVQFYG